MSTQPTPKKITEQDIEQFIQDYLRNAEPLKQKVFHVTMREENMKRCLFGQEKFLIISKCNLAELSVSILRRLPIHLIKQFVVQVEFDSYYYWALTHDIVHHNHIINQSWDLNRNFEVLMASHFANLNAPNPEQNPALMRYNSVMSTIVSQPVKDLVFNADTILMYICYPVLEGLTKFVLSSIVDSNGFPVAQFSAKGQTYNRGSRKISSLSILLHALEENGSTILSKPELSGNLRDFRLEVERMFSTGTTINGWDLIYDLRNASLHGVTGWQLRSGLLTNLISLILWNTLDDNTLTQELKRACRMHMGFGFNYYPPEF